MEKVFDIYIGNSLREIARFINGNGICKDDIVGIMPFKEQVALLYFYGK